MSLMHSRHRNAASGYLRIRNESLTQQSTPQELILLVYESLMDRLVKCQGYLAQAEDADFDREILKSMQLIQYGLRDSLSFDLGGQVAVNLDHTYATWMMALEFLNTSRSTERLASLISSVRDVQEAWKLAFAEVGAQKR
jgi:flagellar secretion chaperone FliS